jgi:hypothetical protein
LSYDISFQIFPYFRAVHDNLMKVVSQTESFRELLTSVLTANLTQRVLQPNLAVLRHGVAAKPISDFFFPLRY